VTKPGAVSMSLPRFLLSVCVVLLTRDSFYVVLFYIICVFCLGCSC